MSARLYGVLVADRERENVGYLMHPECLRELREMIGDGDGFTAPQRLVEMAPGTTDPHASCDLASCGRPVSETTR